MNALEKLVSAFARALPRGGGRIIDWMRLFYDQEVPRRVIVGDIPILLDLRVQLERMMYFDCYEHRLLRFAASLLRPGDVAVDAGAHIGWHSLHYLRRVTRQGAATVSSRCPSTTPG